MCRSAAAAVLALLVAGCEFLGITEKQPVPPCPPVFVLKDAGTLTRYKPGPGRDITDVDFRARIADFQGVCEYNEQRTQVDISLELAFGLMRGPANRDRKASFAYFVAIPHFHPAPQGKNTFELAGSFAGNDSRLLLTDRVHLRIPLAGQKPRLEDYTIYLGFQLTREQLEENRRRDAP